MPSKKTVIKIGVFDSGLGGLSVMGAIHEAIPFASLFYCCDNLNFPYGTKTESQVLEAAVKLTDLFLKRTQIDILVIACNTASVVALDAIRKNLKIPVVGVVPAIKPAAEASKNKIIGVLATPVTISRPYLDDLIKAFASDCKVVKVGSSLLVAIAEEKMRNSGELSAKRLADIGCEVQSIVVAAHDGLDQLVLGCTHFPLLTAELREVIPDSVQFVDSGRAIANRVKTILTEQAFLQDLKKAHDIGDLSGYCSGESFQIVLPKTFYESGRKFELRKLT